MEYNIRGQHIQVTDALRNMSRRSSAAWRSILKHPHLRNNRNIIGDERYARRRGHDSIARQLVESRREKRRHVCLY